MNKYLLPVSLIGLLFLFGCVSYQQITPAKVVSDDKEKVLRFDYMEGQWNSIANNWITGEKVTPYVLIKFFNIDREQAAGEVKEFVDLQENFNWFQRFFTYINLRAVRFYINPPQ